MTARSADGVTVGDYNPPPTRKKVSQSTNTTWKQRDERPPIQSAYNHSALPTNDDALDTRHINALASQPGEVCESVMYDASTGVGTSKKKCITCCVCASGHGRGGGVIGPLSTSFIRSRQGPRHATLWLRTPRHSTYLQSKNCFYAKSTRWRLPSQSKPELGWGFNARPHKMGNVLISRPQHARWRSVHPSSKVISPLELRYTCCHFVI